jgi:hypothetical protein
MTFGMKDQNGGNKMNHSQGEMIVFFSIWGEMIDNLKMEKSKEEVTPRYVILLSLA